MELTQYLQYAVALFFVLALIGLLAWMAKRMRRRGSAMAGSGGRHLGVIEASAVDGQRRLVLVRRDHVGHLLLIGGGQDLLIEKDIPLGVARETQRMHQPMAEPVQMAAEPMAAEPMPAEQHAERPMAPVVRPPAPMHQPATQQPVAPQPQPQPAPAGTAPVAPAPAAPAQPAVQQSNLMQVRPGEGFRTLEDK